MPVHGQFSGEPADAVAAFEDYNDYEVATAPQVVTEELFHYTSTVAALTGILASGTLRLSPYERTNDLWESQPHYPVLSSHYDQRNFDAGFELWDEIDRQLRLHTKVGCLTQDVALPARLFNPDAHRGWAHLSLWAHYGAGHTGVCLRFGRNALVKAFLEHAGPAAFALHGPVRYLSSQDSPPTLGIDVGQVAEFGADAVALAYAEANKESLFFRKHIDWANESEYRLVLLNQSIDFDYIDIRAALTGVVLGSAFPQDQVQGLLEALSPYPEVAVDSLRFLNRRLHCFPFEGDVPQPRPVSPRAWPAPRRAGSLAERLLALRVADAEATTHQRASAQLVQEYIGTFKEGAAELLSELKCWPDAEVTILAQPTAVPAELRARKPGVPGEVIHFEQGFQCVMENLPPHSHTLIAAAAVQILADERMRLHGVVEIEHWLPDGNEHEELWRNQRETDTAGAGAAVATLLHELTDAVQTARVAFDRARGASPGIVEERRRDD
ncbi:DUF2971 domain-containing protein [Streptomyces sp. NPDC048442]|uniref:DUF2971 domain-containing protein n=1 Tax=Streptomyces sp. NPDC048442 TaxID=3154823 RepID=UPI003447D097